MLSTSRVKGRVAGAAAAEAAFICALVLQMHTNKSTVSNFKVLASINKSLKGYEVAFMADR